jgi:tetratricopeptide (TPR) repeat protein
MQQCCEGSPRPQRSCGDGITRHYCIVVPGTDRRITPRLHPGHGGPHVTHPAEGRLREDPLRRSSSEGPEQLQHRFGVLRVHVRQRYVVRVLRYHAGVSNLNTAVGWRMEEREDGGGDELDPYAPVQLGLFTPDRNEVEVAFAALESLDFERAERLFDGILERDPASSDATDGLAAVGHWRGVLASIEQAGSLGRATALWSAVRECPPKLITRNLRRRMLEEVLEMLEVQAEVMPAPDLCAGEVLLELGRIASARSWFGWAARREPDVARLHLLRGDALWAADSVGEARSCYSRGLFLDPTLDRWRSVVWPELARRVREVGGAATALEWWAAGRIPVPPIDADGAPHPDIAEVWRALAEADAARSENRFDDMVRLRLRLREIAPDVFATYMARIEAS